MSPDDQVPSSDAPRSTLPGPAGRGGASPRSTALRRWGPLGAILVVVAVIAALTLTGGDDTDDAETASGGSAEEGGSSTTLDPEVVAKLPVTYAAAEAAGTVDDETWPDTCDPETGKLAIPSLGAYAVLRNRIDQLLAESTYVVQHVCRPLRRRLQAGPPRGVVELRPGLGKSS